MMAFIIDITTLNVEGSLFIQLIWNTTDLKKQLHNLWTNKYTSVIRYFTFTLNIGNIWNEKLVKTHACGRSIYLKRSLYFEINDKPGLSIGTIQYRSDGNIQTVETTSEQRSADYNYK